MARLPVLAGLSLLLCLQTVFSTKLVCYFTFWSENRSGAGKYQISDVNPKLCTHLIFAFAKIDSMNELIPNRVKDESLYQSLNGLKRRNSQLKTLLSVGGWNLGPTQFSSMASSSASRQTFIRSSIKLLRQYGFDGLDLNWRFPAARGSPASDKSSFSLLCQELMEAFTKEANDTSRPRLLLSAAVSAGKAIINNGYDIPTISKYLDFISVMSYNFHGHWESSTGQNSPLYKSSSDNDDNRNVDFAMQYWKDQGAPAEKLLMGFPTYGRTFNLVTEANGVGAPASGAASAGTYTKQKGIWSYYEICTFLKKSTYVWDKRQKVPYSFKGKEWVGFDNIRSFTVKARYLKRNNFGGAFIRTLDLDDFSGEFCGQGKYPLTRRLRSLLNRGGDGFGSTKDFCFGKVDGNHANDFNSSTFYKCVHGTAYLYNCTGGLVFNKSIKTCDWPATAATIPTKVATIPKGFCFGKVDGNHANDVDPSTFYKCVHGTAYLYNCTGGLVFNKSIKTCDWPATAATIPTKVATIPKGFCFGKVDGNHANDVNPSTFYKCVHGTAYLYNCTGGLVFNKSIKTCDWPATAATIPKKVATIPKSFCFGKVDGNHANEWNPNTFYKCVHGTAYLYDCDRGLVFNKSLKVCAWPN